MIRRLTADVVSRSSAFINCMDDIAKSPISVLNDLVKSAIIFHTEDNLLT